MLTFGLVCQVELSDGQDGVAAVVARQIVDGWLQRKIQRGAENAPPRRFIPARKTYSDEISSVWELTVSQDADHGGSWVTEIRCYWQSSNEKLAFLSVAMRVYADDQQLAPVRYYVEPPTFLRDLATKFTVTVGRTRATSVPLSVVDDEGVVHFLDVLRSTERGLPLIVIAEPANGPSPIPDLGKKLAKFLFGLANVVDISRAATFKLTEAIGKEMSVFDGGLRVYWPGWSSQDDIGRHPLFLRRRLEVSALSDSRYPERLIRSSLVVLLTRVAAGRFLYPKIMLATIAAEMRRSLKAQFEASGGAEAIAHILALTQQLVDCKALEEEALAENGRLGDELSRCQGDLVQTRRELERLRVRLRTIRNQAAENADDVADDDPWNIEDPLEAIERARTDFEDTLIIPGSVEVATNQLGGWWYHALMSLHQLCEADRLGQAKNKRANLQSLLAVNGLDPKNTYKSGDTNVHVKNPDTGLMVECRERIHLIEGAPHETESLYWYTLGEAHSASRRYLIARIGRHA